VVVCACAIDGNGELDRNGISETASNDNSSAKAILDENFSLTPSSLFSLICSSQEECESNILYFSLKKA
jgi:hypothetical protein